MVEDNKNKGLFLGIAAATALVGAALLYHFVFSDEAEEEAGSTSNIAADLEAENLHVVKKGPNGATLDPQYMCKLLNFVTTSGRKRREADRKEALDARRTAFKADNWDDYRDIVRDQFQKEDQMCQIVMREVLELLPETSE